MSRHSALSRVLRRGGACLALLVAGGTTALAAGPATSSAQRAGGTASVIVRELPGAGQAPERAVARLGGTVVRQIRIINGFIANIPSANLDALRRAPGVLRVTLNARVKLNLVDGVDMKVPGGPFGVKKAIGAGTVWNEGFRGAGVDVAVIDSGVSPVKGLEAPGKIVYGPDLSFESQAGNLRNLDTYGHGTVMAGLIAGRDPEAPAKVGDGTYDYYLGMAPDARIVSIKVADRTGATDVSQVLAAIDWVVQHKNDPGMNIRVLNLSFGTDGVQDYKIDPLAYAVEVAWKKGVVVVVSAGNGGYGSAKLNNPAYDPYVLAVGGTDSKGTHNYLDDTIPAWSSFGDGIRNPDIVAPGKSIIGLRVPGSALDEAYPAARQGTTPRFFRGSGTSQSAAVVSGAVALMISKKPYLTPDQVKALFMSTAKFLPVADARGQGAGLLDLTKARDAAIPTTAQAWTASTGLGSIDAARGSEQLADEGVPLDGEVDIMGNPWDGRSWSGRSWSGIAWTGGSWNGSVWTGSSWSGSTWTSAAWTGSSWSGRSWSGRSWSGRSWSGRSWSGSGWTGSSWSGSNWTGAAWSSAGWGD
jgi:serine protease AprX